MEIIHGERLTNRISISKMIPYERRIFSSVVNLSIFIVLFSVVDAFGWTDYTFFDMSLFAVQFQKCQTIKMFDDELAAYQQSQSSSPLATRNIVTFQMRFSNFCLSGSDSEDAPYGTYALPLQDYLTYTVNFQREKLEDFCAFCGNCCMEDAGKSYCKSRWDHSYCVDCASTCDDYTGYLMAVATGNTMIADAANYIQCQQAPVPNDDADDQTVYYIGPTCQTTAVVTESSKKSIATTPSQVVIGVFSDANCYDPVYDVNVTEVLGGVQLSYHSMKHTTASSSQNPMQCLLCWDLYEYPETNEYDPYICNEMCKTVHKLAAKCESPTGLSVGFIQTNRDQNNEKTANQVENEIMDCTFIQSINWNSYTETGEINLSGPQDVVERYVTVGQKYAFFCAGLVFRYEKKVKDLQRGGTAGGGKTKALLVKKGEIS